VYRSSAASLLHLGDRARKDSVERGRPFAHSVKEAKLKLGNACVEDIDYPRSIASTYVQSPRS